MNTNDPNNRQPDTTAANHGRTPTSMPLEPWAPETFWQFEEVADTAHLIGPDSELIYSALNLPDGLSIEASTGLISGTTADGAATGSASGVIHRADRGIGGQGEPEEDA